jgi:predicted transcriptional regulator
MTVTKWMEKPMMSALPEMPIWEAARLMLEHDLRALPVLQDGEVIGVLTRDAALRGIFEAWELDVLRPETSNALEEVALAAVC